MDGVVVQMTIEECQNEYDLEHRLDPYCSWVSWAILRRMGKSSTEVDAELSETERDSSGGAVVIMS